jgi:hypothetical protein
LAQAATLAAMLGVTGISHASLVAAPPAERVPMFDLSRKRNPWSAHHENNPRGSPERDRASADAE